MKFNAFIPAAGLGTRLYPLTKNTPKALVEVAGKTLLEHLLLKLKAKEVSEVVINVHHFASQIIDFLNQKQNFGLKIHISDEQEQLLDTGGGLKKALLKFDNKLPVFIHNVDVFSTLSISNLLQYHEQNKSLATLVIKDRATSRYLLFDKTDQLCGWKHIKTGETKLSRSQEALSMFAFSGLHIVSSDMQEKISEQGVFSIIDLYLRLARAEKITAYKDLKSTWLDVGRYSQFSEAEKLFSTIQY